jgi:rhodanese-related sulfurtransferase
LEDVDMRIFFFLLVFSVIIIAGCSSNEGKIINLQAAEFAKLISDEDVFVVDVHIPEQEHIKETNALISYNELEGNADKLPSDKNKPVAIYCRSGSMSAEAAQTLKEMGYKNIYNLLGGAKAWRAEGLEFGEIKESIEKKAIVFKSSSCGCCVGYSAELENQGFIVETKNTMDMNSIKQRYNIPRDMESCHTTVIGDYFVEGHVPFEAVEKLLSEKPDIDGIALPRMPAGSLGMPGTKSGPFVVYALSNGEVSEFVRI